MRLFVDGVLDQENYDATYEPYGLMELDLLKYTELEQRKEYATTAVTIWAAARDGTVAEKLNEHLRMASFVGYEQVKQLEADKAYDKFMDTMKYAYRLTPKGDGGMLEEIQTGAGKQR